MEVNTADIVLCKFYFSDLLSSKNRPVLVFKDNLPYNDFIAIPISSKIENLQVDELIINNGNIEQGYLPIESKLMLRKTFVVSKENVIKKYGTLSSESYNKLKRRFCEYFDCKTGDC